jgi:hypothetical protein
VFESGVELPWLMGLPIPFLDDLFKAQVEYLKEKNKAIEEQYKAQQNGK